MLQISWLAVNLLALTSVEIDRRSDLNLDTWLENPRLEVLDAVSVHPDFLLLEYREIKENKTHYLLVSHGRDLYEVSFPSFDNDVIATLQWFIPTIDQCYGKKESDGGENQLPPIQCTTTISEPHCWAVPGTELGCCLQFTTLSCSNGSYCQTEEKVCFVPGSDKPSTCFREKKCVRTDGETTITREPCGGL